MILNRLKPQAEEIIAEGQAGFRCKQSMTEQIFSLRVLCEKYSQHQQSIYHAFIDLKKAFERVWHDALWATMRKYNMDTKLIQSIKLGVILETPHQRSTCPMHLKSLVPHNSRSPSRLSPVIHIVQYLPWVHIDGMPWKITPVRSALEDVPSETSDLPTTLMGSQEVKRNSPTWWFL